MFNQYMIIMKYVRAVYVIHNRICLMDENQLRLRYYNFGLYLA